MRRASCDGELEHWGPAVRRGSARRGACSCVSGVVRGVGTVWSRCAAAGVCLEWGGSVASGSWSVGARRRGVARCRRGGPRVGTVWGRCAAAGVCLEWSGRVATGSWSVGARRRGEAVPGVGGVVRGVGTVGNMYAEVLRWLCLLCGRVSDCTWRPGLCCCGMLSCG